MPPAPSAIAEVGTSSQGNTLTGAPFAGQSARTAPAKSGMASAATAQGPHWRRPVMSHPPAAGPVFIPLASGSFSLKAAHQPELRALEGLHLVAGAGRAGQAAAALAHEQH